MTEASSVNPPVTFAVFAFNQEEYIKDAVEGAFSQLYEPLEIILSDDCSTDETFAIMVRMAADYRGPHSVRVRRNLVNLGVVNHIDAVVTEMSSEFLVVAAGDDISLPTRTEIVTRPIIMGICEASCTAVSKINSDSIVLPADAAAQVSMFKGYAPIPNSFCVIGSSAAYSKSFLQKALLAVQNSRRLSSLQNEDFVFSFLLYAWGMRIVRLMTSSEVLYRTGVDSLSQNRASGSVLSINAEVQRCNWESRAYRASFSKMLALLEISKMNDAAMGLLDVSHLEKMLEDSRVCCLVTSEQLSLRLKGIFLVRGFRRVASALIWLPGREFTAAVRILKRAFVRKRG